MIIYIQKLGLLTDERGAVIGHGYAGYREGKNNPDLERVENVGPLPRGSYHIGVPFDSPDHGPFCMRLTPEPWTNTFGRGGFLMHGDSKTAPGEASRGCIVMPRPVREAINRATDRTLRVT